MIWMPRHWVRKHILSAICSPTLVHRCSTWRPLIALLIGGAQRDVRPWQCIPLPFGNDYDHTMFVSSMFTLSVTEVDSQPNVITHQPLWTSVQSCSKRIGRLVVVTNLSFYERFTRVNSMRSKAKQCWDVCSDWFFDSHRSTRHSTLRGGVAKW